MDVANCEQTDFHSKFTGKAGFKNVRQFRSRSRETSVIWASTPKSHDFGYNFPAGPTASSRRTWIQRQKILMPDTTLSTGMISARPFSLGCRE